MSANRPNGRDERLFAGPGEEPLPVLAPEQALARSQLRLVRLRMLADAPHLSDERRCAILALVRAQAAIVSKRIQHIRRLS